MVGSPWTSLLPDTAGARRPSRFRRGFRRAAAAVQGSLGSDHGPGERAASLGSLGDGEEQSGEIAGEIVEIPPLLLVFSRDIMYQHSIVTVFFLCSTEQLGPGIKAFRAPVF